MSNQNKSAREELEECEQRIEVLSKYPWQQNFVRTLKQRAIDIRAEIASRASAMPKFTNTYCSQCGREFGPGDHGYSHCDSHRTPEQNAAIRAEQEEQERMAKSPIVGLSTLYAVREALGFNEYYPLSNLPGDARQLRRALEKLVRKGTDGRWYTSQHGDTDVTAIVGSALLAGKQTQDE